LTDNKPRKLTQQQIDGYIITGSQMPGFMGGIFPNVRGGQEWPGLQGQGSRFVLDASGYGVVFFQDGSVFYQPANGWVEDYRTFAAVRGAQGAAAMADLSIFTMEVLMGIASLAGGGVGLVITATNVIQFIHKYQGIFPKVFRVLKALAAARLVLLTLAPTLYSKAVDAVLRAVLSGVYSLVVEVLPFAAELALPNIGAAVGQNVHKSGRAVGKLVGKLGFPALQGKLKIAGAVFKVLLFVIVRVLAAAPASISIRVGEYKKMAEDLIASLRNSGVTIQPLEVQAIFEEIRKNPGRIQGSLKELNDSIEAL
jgi:hypothetical protein